ncbi:MAG: transcriptional repressor [Chloroflexi bacterium]|nr:transcriptional repressor [Chloroflexota bacterium]
MARKTKQREAILRVLKGTTCHPTADWIYEQVRREIPSISLGTVYRNLKLMEQEGEIMDLETPGTVNRFDGNSMNHYHFRCQACGRVFDIDEPVDDGLDERVSRRTGFKVKYHRLEFAGICQECQQG